MSFFKTINLYKINFIKPKVFDNLCNNHNYQTIIIGYKYQYNNIHNTNFLLIDPLQFENDFYYLLNQKKKIIIYSYNWRKHIPYYRFLKENGYKVYLYKNAEKEKSSINK